MTLPFGYKIRHWTPEEWERTTELARQGKTDRQIGEAIGRSKNAVHQKRMAKGFLVFPPTRHGSTT